MAKKLDLNKTVYELTQEYPELIKIMAGLGFTEIIKKPMLHSVGKIMTIPKDAKMKNISMMDVVTTLMGKGFELVGEMPDMSSAPQAGTDLVTKFVTGRMSPERLFAAAWGVNGIYWLTSDKPT